MIDTKTEAIEVLKKTINLLDEAKYNLIDVSACWDKIDEKDIERLKCSEYSIQISRIMEHLKEIK